MPIKITGILPDENLYIGKLQSKKIKAEGLFEKNIDGDDVPLRGLVFGILDNDGKSEDSLFEIEPTPTDEVTKTHFPTIIFVPEGKSIEAGQKRLVFIRHRDERIVGGKCPDNSKTCDISSETVLISK